MSWLYSRALVEEFSAGTCSDGARSALLSGSPMPQAFLPSDRMTDFSRPSRFGMTFAPLTDDLGAELLTWFLAASHARTSAWPERAQASAANDPACGPTWRGSLARFDRDSRSWKTVQLCLLGDSELSSVTWPRSGMTADGQCWELPMSELRTSGTDSGLWPTPTASLGTNGGRVTPAKAREGGTLIEALSARTKWRSPNTVDAKGGTRKGDGQLQLCHQVGGNLNPTWVEWLMGWPLGWTDLEPLATDKYLCAPLKHGAC